jgi:hypothetical protein
MPPTLIYSVAPTLHTTRRLGVLTPGNLVALTVLGIGITTMGRDTIINMRFLRKFAGEYQLNDHRREIWDKA